jgi:hypothetical protein
MSHLSVTVKHSAGMSHLTVAGRVSHSTVTGRYNARCPIWLLQADIVPELAPCYESEDETMGRRNKVASDLHLQRNKRGTRLYSKDDFREHYCITSKQLDVLERARGSGLFGCLSNYHVSSMYARHCTDTSSKILFTLALNSKVYPRAALYRSKQLDTPKWFLFCTPLHPYNKIIFRTTLYCKENIHQRCCVISKQTNSPSTLFLDSRHCTRVIKLFVRTAICCREDRCMAAAAYRLLDGDYCEMIANQGNKHEISALLGYYAASCGNCLPTFRDNVSVPSSWVKSPSTLDQWRWDRYVVPKRR